MEAALLLFPRVPLRASSMLLSEWQYVDFDNNEWKIPADNMKGEIGKRRDFVIPMSTQVKDILLKLNSHRTNKFLFPSGGKSGHLTVEGVNKTMHIAGIPKGKMCVHGWRKVWGTLAREYGVPDKIVERGLAHTSGDSVEMAYNRAEYKSVLRHVFQWWCDFLNALTSNAPIPQVYIPTNLIYS